MRAFCPGHITGFFAIDMDSDDALKRGSVGAGFCVAEGAIARVSISESDVTDIAVTLDGRPGEAPVTAHALNSLLPPGNWSVRSDIENRAPLGQGVGMSAAGTYASSLALCGAIGKRGPEALEAAHSAEVRFLTGLGDVIAQSVGGFVERTGPGIPPYGRAVRLEIEPREVVLCFLEGGVATSEKLSSAKFVEEVSEAGSRCLEAFGKKRDLDNFMAQSWTFAMDTGLATVEIQEVVESVSDVGQASMIMLGNGAFAFGDADEIAKRFGEYGKVMRTRVYGEPAAIF